MNRSEPEPEPEPEPERDAPLNVLFVCSRNQWRSEYMDPELVELLGDPVADLLGVQR